MRAALAALLFGVVAAAAQEAPQETPQGKRIFTQDAAPPCGVCHVLSDAGTAGRIGPNLDMLKPSAERVRAAVTEGPGTMPAYGQLSLEQVEAVARYVAEVTGG